MDAKNSILSIDQHLSCKNYTTKISTGFRYVEVKAGDKLGLENMPFNYIYCTLKGRYTLSYGQYVDREFKEGDMILLPHMSSYIGRVLEDIGVLVFGFDVPQSNCDKILFETANQWCENIVYDFRPITIGRPMRVLFDSIVFYLSQGIDCGHLHEIKHREFFIVLRSFYSKTNIAQLLYPLIGVSYDFKNMILKNYRRETSLSDLMSTVGMSRSTFFTHFKKEFKMTPKKWIAEQIRQDILHLATDPKLSAKEIMDKLNFDCHSQFNRFCQNNYGSTPSHLIEEIRKASRE